jgi:hypothetical protein
MLSIATDRLAGALFFLVTGVVLAWAGDHYAFAGGLAAIVAVWLIAFGAMELVLARRKHGWWWATLLAFGLTLAFVAVAVVREITEPAQGYAGNCAVLIDTVASTGVVPVSIVEPPRRAVSCSTAQHGVLLRQFNQIDVWGVVSRHQQQTVLDSLRRTRSSEHTAPIHVSFWEKENWGECPPPNSQGAHCRGPELMIRDAIVN